MSELKSHVETKVGSDRSFGLIFAVVFAIAGFLPLFKHHNPKWVALIFSSLFLCVSLTLPRILAPLNNLWFRLGLLLGRLVNPVVMAILFFLVITPIGICMRLAGKDPLRLKFYTKEKSYWINKSPQLSTMKDQF